jgi:hypothetical protein
LLVNTAYQSSLISVLTNPQFEPAVDTVEKLLNSDMKYGYVAPIKPWYRRADDTASKTILKEGRECPTLHTCLKTIVSTKHFAVCGGGLHLLYLSYKKEYSYSGEQKFIPFKDEVLSYLASMFFRSGSPFLESFNRIIYRLVESGLVDQFWEDIRRRHIGGVDEDGDGDEDEDAEGDGSDAVVLTVDHLQGAFILLLLGLAFGLIVLIIELLCFIFRKYIFYQLSNPSVCEFKTRSLVNYKRHVIHKTLVSRVEKRNLIHGKAKN